MRHDNRAASQTREITIERNYTKYAQGSVLVSYGNTKVLCTAFIQEEVPPFLRNSGKGWLTAEYSLLPSATHTRVRREVSKGKASGRTNEIQRLIGRSLRAIMDLDNFGERTVYIDADVIQADGGTRTAAITGGMIALWDAVQDLLKKGLIETNPIREFLAAISVGVVDGKAVCDLNYEEDSQADVDMNLVMTQSGKFVEIQGTAESFPFTPIQLQEMMTMGQDAIALIIQQAKLSVGA